MPPFSNKYHLRKVAESSSKACAFCFKPTTTVLITSDGVSDFFYTCDNHLKDDQFASPIFDDEYLLAKKEKNELELQMKQLKLKWDEKNRYVSWDKFVNYTKSFTTSTEDKEDKDKDVNSIKDDIKEINTKTINYDKILSKQQRVYQLNQQIYKIRLDKKRQQNVTNTDKSSMKDLSNLPSVPKNSI